MTHVSEQQQRLVRIAARALGNHQLAHAYGHCSLRLNHDFFLVCAPRPMGLIKPGEPGIIVPVDGELPTGVLGEVRIHQQIYKKRTDVGGICRSMPKSVMALSTLGKTPRALHGFSAYFWPQVPLWDDPQLIRDDKRASAVADTAAHHKAVVMRGNGLITLACDLQRAVVWAWYLDNAADIELRILPHSEQAKTLTESEAATRATEKGGIIERMWEYLTQNDPET